MKRLQVHFAKEAMGRTGRIIIATALVVVPLVLGVVFHAFRTAPARAQELPDFINAPADAPSMCIKSPTPTMAFVPTPTPKPTCGPTRIATPSPTPDLCLKGLTVPTPMPGLHRLVQLVNCSNQTVLGTANAAQQKGKQLLPVLPREGTWIMGPQGSGKNVLNIDIPLGWEDTKCPQGQHMCEGIVGPRLWARTGCSYDLDFDKALCETGACAGRYDCSAARLSASVGTTVSEWTLAEPVKSGSISYLKDSPDISAVDGANLNLDIQPIDSSAHDPFDKLGGHDIQWLAEQYPLTVHGEDLRADASCNVASFRLKRSQRPFVIVDSSGVPVGGDSTIACFSNCGRYAFPTPPPKSCNENTDHTCFLWKSFCLGDPSKYGGACTLDGQCPVAGACWNNPGSALNCTCQGRAFIKNDTCPPDVCTYPYGYIDPVKCIQFFSTQPPFGHCTDVTDNPDECIGDDTIHAVMPKAYSWPNDPQVYGGDASRYRVIFAPGGTSEAITKTSTLLMCNDKLFMGAPYHYETQVKNCTFNLAYGAMFGIAFPNPGVGKNPLWSCDLDPSGSGDNGVVCRWPLPSPPPPILQIGFRVNFSQADTTLQLAVNPSATVGDLLLATVTFNANATPTAPSGWTLVPGADVTSLNKAQRTTVWYHFVKAGDATSYTWKWNAAVNPAGAITSWRGVDPKTPFDTTPAVMTGTITASPDTAIAPSIKTATANARLLSIYGAGGTGSNQPSFALPVGNKVGNETGAAKLNVLPTGTYFAHLVGDRIEPTPGMTLLESVQITQQNGGKGGDWTAISMALRPAPKGPTPTPSVTPKKATATPKITPKPTSTPKVTPKPTPTRKVTPKATPTPKVTPKATPTATGRLRTGPTPTPKPGAIVASTSVTDVAPPGTTVDAGTFTLTNDLTVMETVASATVSVSHAGLFSSMTLKGSGQSVTVTPPTANTTFTFSTPVTVAAGGSVTFSLSAVIAANPVMLGNEIKYAGLTVTASVLGSGSTWPLSGALLMLGMTLLGLTNRTRRRALILAVLALGLAAASTGCGSGNNGPRLETSSQEVTAVNVTAGGVVPETVAGVPASLGTVSD